MSSLGGWRGQRTPESVLTLVIDISSGAVVSGRMEDDIGSQDYVRETYPPASTLPRRLPSPSIASSHRQLPHVLFTGFSVFPGAPQNPTETLLPILSEAYSTGLYADLCASLSTVIFPVEYESLPARLSSLSDPSSGIPKPDIVVHFGLAGKTEGIRLERLARNACGGHPDNAGFRRSGRIIEVAESLAAEEEIVPSRLPLEAIHTELERKGIPTEWSDDAGGYLCNYIFYLSASTAPQKPCPDWTPEMVGFIHVPPVETVSALGEKTGMDMAVMRDAAETILEVCCKAWRESGTI